MLKTFAVLKDNLVVNVVVGVEPEVVEANPGLYVEYTEENPAGIGWTYDATTGSFTNPEVVENTDGL
jgi:hypothetical protein